MIEGAALREDAGRLSTELIGIEIRLFEIVEDVDQVHADAVLGAADLHEMHLEARARDGAVLEVLQNGKRRRGCRKLGDRNRRPALEESRNLTLDVENDRAGALVKIERLANAQRQ